jgi:hypothetical protein
MMLEEVNIMEMLMDVSILLAKIIVDLWLSFKKYSLAISYKLRYLKDIFEHRNFILQRIPLNH